ncbi:hypothetical protein G6F21_011073 [Rhizopus arrhizus]|uniref:Uncharacterized protein n=1 Tax=Rhizopus oryzae TaxID=64495 RepID=A0A9P6X0I0_RHIOR|nr:hypothetical protein G6F23_008828 [Rhizopus arrhizus]KAG0756381.1 hypothetical protein G6F24_011189 [Rhizopus arrhizus]KAG0782513.1 hypothetical protein G6F21_011073 [Rhizopus arrhizus]KAG0960457.1 hypothetical protein G6F31_010634 [Rhizopus arrhizus]KAG1283514.1 hypothetical protein G6F66_010896 [Rhizopus arrhizus]
MIINNNIAEDDILDQGYKDAETSLANDTNSVDRTEVPEEHEPPKQKKRKALHKKEFKTLDRAEQLKKLTEFYGTEGVLDLTRKAFIPKKFASDIEALKKVYGLNLPYLLKKEEHYLLKKIAQCRNKKGLYAAVKDIDPFTKGSALPYIKQAVQKLCYLYKDNPLEDHDHNEDWFRIMVYGDLFDYIFSSAEGYMTKEVSIPVSERSGGAIADFISVIISLIRAIMKNIDIIETILQIIHEDNLNFLAPKDSFIYESDSDSSTDSTLSTSSNLKYNWKATEREERIKERVNEQYQSQYVSTDWEISHLLFCALRNIFYEILISPKHLNVAELNSNLINFRLLSDILSARSFKAIKHGFMQDNLLQRQSALHSELLSLCRPSLSLGLCFGFPCPTLSVADVSVGYLIGCLLTNQSPVPNILTALFQVTCYPMFQYTSKVMNVDYY